MVTRIVYDTEFIDDGSTVAPLSIAMVRPSDDATFYAINSDLATMARAAEHDWLRANVLPWLPLHVDLQPGYGALNAHVSWDTDHPDYAAVKPLDEIRDGVEDFVLAHSDPQLWAYYASYDHVLYAQLFGPMAELPDGMPMHTMDLKHEAVMFNDIRLPKLPQPVVDGLFGGQRKEHHALFDAVEEGYQLLWLLKQNRKMRF